MFHGSWNPDERTDGQVDSGRTPSGADSVANTDPEILVNHETWHEMDAPLQAAHWLSDEVRAVSNISVVVAPAKPIIEA